MRKQIRKKEIKELNAEIMENFGVSEFLDKKAKVEVEDELVFVNDELVFFRHEGKLVPCLKLILKRDFLKKVVVDMPAVKFMVSGADVMRPGIKAIDEGVNSGDVVVIVDEQHSKPLAIGVALFSGSELMAMHKGKVIKNIHHVGDKVWSL